YATLFRSATPAAIYVKASSAPTPKRSEEIKGDRPAVAASPIAMPAAARAIACVRNSRCTSPSRAPSAARRRRRQPGHWRIGCPGTGHTVSLMGTFATGLRLCRAQRLHRIDRRRDRAPGSCRGLVRRGRVLLADLDAGSGTGRARAAYAVGILDHELDPQRVAILVVRGLAGFAQRGETALRGAR